MLLKTNIVLQGRLIFNLFKNFNFTLGGSFNYNGGGTARRSAIFRDFMRRYELFDAEHTPEITNNVYRIYGRFHAAFCQ